MATKPATTPAIASLASFKRDAALRCEFEHADQQADQTGGADVEPGQAQQARDGRGGQAETEDLHRALSRRRRLRERAKLRVSFRDADTTGHHVFGDAIGLAQLVEVRISGRETDHARRIRDACGSTRIAEGQDHARGVRPRFAISPRRCATATTAPSRRCAVVP
jgi:hypothetical protein